MCIFERNIEYIYAKYKFILWVFLDIRVRLDSRQSEVIKSYNNILLVQNLSMSYFFLWNTYISRSLIISFVFLATQHDISHSQGQFSINKCCTERIILICPEAECAEYDNDSMIYFSVNRLARKWFYDLFLWTTLDMQDHLQEPPCKKLRSEGRQPLYVR